MALDMRFDSRIVERNIAKGVVTREEYEAHLASLGDAAKKAATIDLVQPLFGSGEEDATTPAKSGKKS